jgi:hypothetical protein
VDVLPSMSREPESGVWRFAEGDGHAAQTATALMAIA